MFYRDGCEKKTYSVGRLSRFILCKIDSKWCALLENHDEGNSRGFMFGLVWAMFSSFQLLVPGLSRSGLHKSMGNGC